MTGYLQFYHLSRDPFLTDHDPVFFFPAKAHQEALSSMIYGIRERKGFVAILGDAGMGKTALIQELMAKMDGNVKVIRISQPYASYPQLLKEILGKLGLSSEHQTKGSMLHELYNYLIQALSRDENVAIVIDDAQDLSDEILEEVRLASNLETGKFKLLQIVLVGRPELEEKLNLKRLRQLRQRIGIINRLAPLTQEESLLYIDHRLKCAESGSDKVFTPEALSLICEEAKGVPRMINILCGKFLDWGCLYFEAPISAGTARKILGKPGISSWIDSKAVRSGGDRKVRSVALLGKKSVLLSPYFWLTLVFLALAVFYGTKYFGSFSGIKTLRIPVSEPKSPGGASIEAKPETDVFSREISSAGRMKKKVETDQSAVTEPAPASVVYSRGDVAIRKIIEVRKGETLSKVIVKHSGSVSPTLLDYVLEVNPEIKDVDIIQNDRRILLPQINESAMIMKSSEGLFKVHLRTFIDYQEALAYKELMGQKFGIVEIVSRKVTPQKTWYRVLAGPFGSQEEGRRAIQTLRQGGLL